MTTYRQFIAEAVAASKEELHHHEFEVGDVTGGIRQHVRAAKKFGVHVTPRENSYPHAYGKDYILHAHGTHENVTKWAKSPDHVLFKHDLVSQGDQDADHPFHKKHSTLTVHDLKHDTPAYHDAVSKWVKSRRES